MCETTQTRLHAHLSPFRSSTTIAVLVVVCSVLTGGLAGGPAGGLAAYQNDWGDSFYVICNKNQGEALYRVQSRHSNSKEDRRWKWQCKRVVPGAMSNCNWTDWSIYGQQFDFQCNDEDYKVMSGVRSVHSNQKGGRKWSFYCCKSTRFCPRQCRWSNYINNWGGYMHYIAPNNRIFTGVMSDYDPTKK